MKTKKILKYYIGKKMAIFRKQQMMEFDYQLESL